MDSLEEIRAAARNIFLTSYHQQARLCLSTLWRCTAAAEKPFKTSLDPSKVFAFENGRTRSNRDTQWRWSNE